MNKRLFPYFIAVILSSNTAGVHAQHDTFLTHDTPEEFITAYKDNLLAPNTVSTIDLSTIKLGDRFYIRVDQTPGNRTFRYRYELLEVDGSAYYFERRTTSLSEKQIEPAIMIKVEAGIHYYRINKYKTYVIGEGQQCRFIIGKCYQKYKGEPIEVISTYEKGLWNKHFSNDVRVTEIIDKHGFTLYKEIHTMRSSTRYRRERYLEEEKETQEQKEAAKLRAERIKNALKGINKEYEIEEN
jgi:hypothetical protein